jgi:hypothetical protein
LIRRSAASVSSTSSSSSFAGGEGEEPSLEDEQLAAGLPGIETRLLEGDADPLAHRVGLARDVEPGHPSLPCCDREQRRQHPHRGRLARAVGAEEAEDLPGLDPQIDAAHRLDRARPAAVGLDEPCRLDGWLTGLGHE